jgi:HAE1 family hydrophobic/amphiphilic exporter-1
MNYMYSLNSTADGLMRLIVDYDVKTDPNTDLMLTQMRQTQAASQLPSDVANYGVTVQKTVTAPLMLVTLYSPNGTYGRVCPRAGAPERIVGARAVVRGTRRRVAAVR